ncbi:bcl-2-associated transcription factor 1 [Gastrophryne carolinensis]
MGRSNSGSRSSRSKSRSPSSSRSRSHSRKKRYSSRSRSRTYSRSRSRERVYHRDFRRDYRNNRGMRRPYGFRGRPRGYFQGGGGRYFRGGYRPMWNRRYSRSPRRGRSRSRSRSRTPKRRSASSQRSRSRSPKSYKSSPSPRSSSSDSSSRYSKSPERKPRASKDKKRQKSEPAEKLASPVNDKSDDENKDAFDPSEPIDELGKDLDLHGETWAGLSAYDNSPRSPSSPSQVASPPSSPQSDCPILSVVHSGKDTLSQNSHSIAQSPEKSASGSAGNDSARYSPSQNSPIDIPAQESPTKPVLTQQHDEQPSHFSLYSDEEELTKSTKIPKRHTDEEHRLFPIEQTILKEKEIQKERPLDISKTELGKSWGVSEALDMFLEKEPVNQLTVSDTEDLEEVEDYRQFRKAVLADQGKGLSSAAHWNSEEEVTKHKSKASTKVTKEKGRESKREKVSTKDRHKGSDKNTDKAVARKVPVPLPDSPEPVILEKDQFSYKLPLHQSEEVKDRAVLREESPLRIRVLATDSHHPVVKFRMTVAPVDDARPPSLATDRLLASTLVHSFKKQRDFRSIFDHLKVPFSSRTSPEAFICHIVSLVQYVKEHYFKGEGKTLSERFAEYQTVTEAHASLKSPEIHRRIDVSPKLKRRRASVQSEEQMLTVKEEHAKVGKKLRKNDSTEVRIERKKERAESKSSRESTGSRKREKIQKEAKEKSFKDESKRRKDPEPSPPLSDEEKDIKKESRDEEFKGPMDPKEYAGFSGIGKPRGTFQFRIRGRGRARGVFAGTSTASVTTAPGFQQRPKEEEWDPEYTPKSKKYFLHDDRDDGVDYWARRARGRGNFQRGRGRFPFKKSESSPKWTHDKFQGDGLEEEEEEMVEDRTQEEKE